MKLPKLKPGDPVLVYWLDAASHGAQWSDDHEAEPLEAHCFTLGFFSTRKGKFLVVSQTWERDGEHSRFEIPVGCIEQITVLKEIQNPVKREKGVPGAGPKAD